MEIYTSAHFEGSEIGFSSIVSLQSSEAEILEQKELVKNHCIKHLKVKCADYFKVNFDKLVSIEIYIYSDDATKLKPIILFKKVKTENE